MHTIEELHNHYKAVKARLNKPVIKIAQKPPAPPPQQPTTPLVDVRPNVQIKARTKSDRILIETALKHGFMPHDLKGKGRKHKMTIARHECMYRLRHELGLSFPAIGRFLRKDHTTVMHGCLNHEKIQAKMQK